MGIKRHRCHIAALKCEKHKSNYALPISPCSATISTLSQHPYNRPSWVYNAISVFLLSLVFYPIFPAALAMDREVVQWAKDFYQKGAFCSVASIGNLSIGTDRIVVTLDIDRRWAEALVKKPDIRDRWFAIHCPVTMRPLWSEFGKNQDIIIEGRLPNYGIYALSCGAYQENRHRQNAARRESVADKAANIRERLGLPAKPGRAGQ